VGLLLGRLLVLFGAEDELRGTTAIIAWAPASQLPPARSASRKTFA
jgi:hypothetical protein